MGNGGDVDVVTATDSENVKGTVHTNTTSSNGSAAKGMKMDATFTSKWIGSSCGDVQ